jgi:hypothetical protein
VQAAVQIDFILTSSQFRDEIRCHDIREMSGITRAELDKLKTLQADYVRVAQENDKLKAILAQANTAETRKQAQAALRSGEYSRNSNGKYQAATGSGISPAY